MGEDGLCLDGQEERILTLLAVAYRGDVPGAALGMFRRVSKHWQRGDKCLAPIHLAQSGLPEIDEDAAYRLSLAAKLIDAGMTPRKLARELEPSFVWKTLTLAKYEPVSELSPVFHWIDNDRLTIDLGQVRDVWSMVDKVGSIHIAYAYIKVGTN